MSEFYFGVFWSSAGVLTALAIVAVVWLAVKDLEHQRFSRHNDASSFQDFGDVSGHHLAFFWKSRDNRLDVRLITKLEESSWGTMIHFNHKGCDQTLFYPDTPAYLKKEIAAIRYKLGQPENPPDPDVTKELVGLLLKK
jgi:hypothetical protein